MAYIDKGLGELIIKRVYEFVSESNKHYDEVIKNTQN